MTGVGDLAPGVHHDVVDLDGLEGADRADDPAGVEALLARRGLPLPVAGPELEHMAGLTRRVSVARRIMVRTRDRTAREVVAHAAATRGSGVALHPDAIREAAAAVLAARERLARAEAAGEAHPTGERVPGETTSVGSPLSAAGIRPPPGESDVLPADALAADADADGLTDGIPSWNPRAGKRNALAAGLVGGGVAVGLAGLGVDLWVVLAPLLAGLLLASFALRVPTEVLDAVDARDRSDDLDEIDVVDIGGEGAPEAGHAEGRGMQEHGPGALDATEAPDGGDRDAPEGADRLAAVTALAERAYGGGPAAPTAAADEQVTRELTLEDLRVAERAWRSLAGDDADPADVERVVRRHDPQHRDALIIAAEATAVRAAGRLLERAVDAWSEAWTALGQGDPEADLDHEGAMDDLVRRARAPVVLGPGAAERVSQVASRLPAAPVVVVGHPDRAGTSPDATVPGSGEPGTTGDPTGTPGPVS